MDFSHSLELLSKKGSPILAEETNVTPLQNLKMGTKKQMAKNLPAIISLLQNIPVFAGVKDYEMQIIAHGVEQITLSKDEILLQQGECSNAMYVLKEGLLQISRKRNVHDFHEKPQVVGVCQVGTSFGDAALGEYIAKLWGERNTSADRDNNGASFIAVKSFNDLFSPISGVVSNTVYIHSKTAVVLKLTQEVFGNVMSSIMSIRKKKNFQVALFAIRHKPSLERLKYVEDGPLAKYMQVARFQRKASICRVGKTIKFLHILVQGTCTLRMDGGKYTTTLQPGDVFGEILVEIYNTQKKPKYDFSVISTGDEQAVLLLLDRRSLHTLLTSASNTELEEQKLVQRNKKLEGIMTIESGTFNAVAELHHQAMARSNYHHMSRHLHIVSSVNSINVKSQERVDLLLRRVSKYITESLFLSVYGKWYRNVMLEPKFNTIHENSTSININELLKEECAGDEKLYSVMNSSIKTCNCDPAHHKEFEKMLGLRKTMRTVSKYSSSATREDCVNRIMTVARSIFQLGVDGMGNLITEAQSKFIFALLHRNTRLHYLLVHRYHWGLQPHDYDEKDKIIERPIHSKEKASFGHKCVEQFQSLYANARYMNFPPFKWIYTAETPGTCVYVILRGCVRTFVHKRLSDADTVTRMIQEDKVSGDYFGESCLEGLPMRDNAAMATTKVEVLCFEYFDFLIADKKGYKHRLQQVIDTISVEKKLDFLHQVPLLKALDSGNFLSLARELSHVHIKKGQIVCRRHRIQNELCFVFRGQIDIVTDLKPNDCISSVHGVPIDHSHPSHLPKALFSVLSEEQIFVRLHSSYHHAIKHHKIREYTDSQDPVYHVIASMGKGNFLGESGFLTTLHKLSKGTDSEDHDVWTEHCSAIAATPVDLLYLSRDGYKLLAAAYANFVQHYRDKNTWCQSRKKQYFKSIEINKSTVAGSLENITEKTYDEMEYEEFEKVLASEEDTDAKHFSTSTVRNYVGDSATIGAFDDCSTINTVQTMKTVDTQDGSVASFAHASSSHANSSVSRTHSAVRSRSLSRGASRRQLFDTEKEDPSRVDNFTPPPALFPELSQLYLSGKPPIKENMVSNMGATLGRLQRGFSVPLFSTEINGEEKPLRPRPNTGGGEANSFVCDGEFRIDQINTDTSVGELSIVQEDSLTLPMDDEISMGSSKGVEEVNMTESEDLMKSKSFGASLDMEMSVESAFSSLVEIPKVSQIGSPLVSPIYRPMPVEANALEHRLGRQTTSSIPVGRYKQWKTAMSVKKDGPSALPKEEIPIIFAKTYNPYVVLNSIPKPRMKHKVDNCLSLALFPSHKSFASHQRSTTDILDPPKSASTSRPPSAKRVVNGSSPRSRSLNEVGIVDSRQRYSHNTFADAYFKERRQNMPMPERLRSATSMHDKRGVEASSSAESIGSSTIHPPATTARPPPRRWSVMTDD